MPFLSGQQNQYQHISHWLAGRARRAFLFRNECPGCPRRMVFLLTQPFKREKIMLDSILGPSWATHFKVHLGTHGTTPKPELNHGRTRKGRNTFWTHPGIRRGTQKGKVPYWDGVAG